MAQKNQKGLWESTTLQLSYLIQWSLKSLLPIDMGQLLQQTVGWKQLL